MNTTTLITNLATPLLSSGLTLSEVLSILSYSINRQIPSSISMTLIWAVKKLFAIYRGKQKEDTDTEDERIKRIIKARKNYHVNPYDS